MNPVIDSLMKQLQNKYKNQEITFDDSYVKEVEKFYEWLLNTSIEEWSIEFKENTVLPEVVLKVSEFAEKMARERHKNVIDASLFREALEIYKCRYKFYGGPIRPPDRKSRVTQ